MDAVERRQVIPDRSGAEYVGEIGYSGDPRFDKGHLLQLRVQDSHGDRRLGQGILCGQCRGAGGANGNDQFDGGIFGQGGIVVGYPFRAPRRETPMLGEEVDRPGGAHHPVDFVLEQCKITLGVGRTGHEVEQKADMENVLLDLGPRRQHRRQQSQRQ